MWLAWGLAVGLLLGTLAVTPDPQKAVSRAEPALVAGSRAGGAGALAPTLIAAPVSMSGPPWPVVPLAEEGSASTDIRGAPYAAAVAGSPAEGERVDEDDRRVAVGADGDQAEAVDGSLDEGSAPIALTDEADAPAAPAPAPSDVVFGTIRDPLRSGSWVLRATPSTSARALTSLVRGTRVEILPQTASGGGFAWLRVRTQAGAVGWVVAEAVLR